MLIIPKGSQTQNSIAVLWEKNRNTDTYSVYVNGEKYAKTPNTNYTVENLLPDTEYEIYVCAGNKKSESVKVKTKPLGTVYNIVDFGAVADGKTVNTKAIQDAIDKCKKGDTVYVPEGDFVSGAIYLRSNMTFMVDGRLLGSLDLKDYPIMEYRWEGRERMCYASLVNSVSAGRLENITICGNGTIDANGNKLFDLEMSERNGSRGRAVCIRNTDKLYIKDITIRQSPSWCLHVIYCHDVALDNVKIHTRYDENGNKYDHIYNGDGFDPDSCDNVYVFGCEINSQDDCIALKSGRDEEGRRVAIPMENVRITNCKFGSGFGVAIGSESAGDIRNVFVQDCVFHNTYSVASVKSPRGRGSVMENIHYEDCVHENTSTEFHDCAWFRGAIYVDVFYGHETFDPNEERPADETTPIIRDVHFKNIKTRTTAGNAIFLAGLPESYLENITFENVEAHGKFGMKAHNVKGLKLENVKVISDEDEEFVYNNVEMQ